MVYSLSFPVLRIKGRSGESILFAEEKDAEGTDQSDKSDSFPLKECRLSDIVFINGIM
jgi:hypothetical protein